MRKIILIMAFMFCCGMQAQQNYTQYVNPMIGTGDHGHVFLGAKYNDYTTSTSDRVYLFPRFQN